MHLLTTENLLKHIPLGTWKVRKDNYTMHAYTWFRYIFQALKNLSELTNTVICTIHVNKIQIKI